jgi:hypothetical protein
MVVGISVMLGLWLHARSVDRSPVLVLRADVARGEVLDRTDLRVTEIDTEDELSLLGPDRVDEVEGRVAVMDLQAGSLVSVDQFTAGGLVGAGDGVVGLALDPGEYPILTLRPGDVVRVVATPDPGAATAEVSVLVEEAEVVDVAAVGGQDRLFVSLVMPAGEADEVAAAGAEDRARLIQVGSSS